MRDARPFPGSRPFDLPVKTHAPLRHSSFQYLFRNAVCVVNISGQCSVAVIPINDLVST